MQQGVCVQTFKCYSLSKYIKSWVWGHSIFKPSSITCTENTSSPDEVQILSSLPKCNNQILGRGGSGGQPKVWVTNNTPQDILMHLMIHRAPTVTSASDLS